MMGTLSHHSRTRVRQACKMRERHSASVIRGVPQSRGVTLALLGFIRAVALRRVSAHIDGYSPRIVSGSDPSGVADRRRRPPDDRR